MVAGLSKEFSLCLNPSRSSPMARTAFGLTPLVQIQPQRVRSYRGSSGAFGTPMVLVCHSQQGLGGHHVLTSSHLQLPWELRFLLNHTFDEHGPRLCSQIF